MKILKKIMGLVLSGMMMFSVCSCGNNNSTSSKTLIKVFAWDGGFGTQWLEEAMIRFEEKNANVEYESGKKGVEFVRPITKSKSSDASTMNTSGTDLYFNGDTASAKELAQKEFLACLDDIILPKDEVRDGKNISIEDKIHPTFRTMLKANDGKYYALPYASYHNGVTYDKTLFDNMCFYIADPVANGENTADDLVEWTAFGTTINLVASLDVKKSCGADGAYGTADDGFPTSITELLAFCDYIHYKGISPFHFTGANPGYTRLLSEALALQLSTVEEVNATLNFTGTVNYVAGYKDEPLFEDIDYIKKPNVQSAEIKESNGYLTTKLASDYYGMAFINIAYKEGWFSNAALQSTISHLDAQSLFLTNGYNSGQNSTKYAMMIEGSYWMTEATENGKHKDYEKIASLYNLSGERDVRWMPLPVSVDTVIDKEGEGVTRLSTISTRKCFVYMNKRSLNKAGTAKACKEFLKFLYSDVELENYTVSSGIIKTAMDYKVSPEKLNNLSIFQKSVFELIEDTEAIVMATENKLYNDNFTAFTQRTFFPTIDGKYHNSVLEAFKSGYSVDKVFDAIAYDETKWSKYYSA